MYMNMFKENIYLNTRNIYYLYKYKIKRFQSYEKGRKFIKKV